MLCDEILNSSQNIYNELMIYEIDGILHILQCSSCRQCPLRIKSGLKKLGKSKLLAFILGHIKHRFPPKRKRIILRTLQHLYVMEIKRSVPEDVIRVTLANRKFNNDLQQWLDNSPVPISFELPIAPFSFDIFSYPDISQHRSQVESRIIDPSHCLTNLRLHTTQKGFFWMQSKCFLESIRSWQYSSE